MVETIQWTNDGVVMIDQTRLPREEVFVTCRTYEDVAHAIRTMIIRGAPAITRTDERGSSSRPTNSAPRRRSFQSVKRNVFIALVALALLVLACAGWTVDAVRRFAGVRRVASQGYARA